MRVLGSAVQIEHKGGIDLSIERALQLSCSKNGQKRMVRRDNPADYGDVGLARLYRDGRGRITFVTACGLRRIIVGTKLLKHM